MAVVRSFNTDPVMQPSCAYEVQYGCDDSFESDVLYFCVRLQGQTLINILL